jgi:ABC-type nitrate/sulfonate/bicarbonate transport system ATPase subunit
MGTVTVESIDLRFNSRNGGEVIALNNLSLTVPDKQFAVIVGPSGCGKSSLLDIIAGLKEPSGGECRLDGKPISGPGRERGMVFQNYSLFPWLTVLKNVAFGLTLQGQTSQKALERARHYVNAVGLSRFENAYPNQLSGGMKQRVAIARSLANDPEVILMDEPFGALDSQTRGVMQQLLLGIWEKEHKTILFVTHDIDEALFLGEKVYVMSARPGRIIDTISVEFAHPRSYELSTEPAFAELKRRIQRSLHGEVHKALSDAA